MKRQEKIVYWGGVIFLIALLHITLWLLLALFSWYIKRVPERRLPMTTLLSGNQKTFYEWLSGFLWDWLKSSIIWTLVIGFIELLLGLGLYMVAIFANVSLPINFPLVAYLTIVLATLVGLYFTKSNKWDALFWQAEPTAKMLVGSEEYELMSEEDKNRVKRNIVDSLIGINKATLVVAGGKIQTHNPPAGDLARFGGTGVLIVQEGHAVVLERGGRRSRIVGTGVWHLGMFERVNMVVPLAQRTVPIEVENVVTEDHVVITKIKLLAFTRLSR